MHELSLIWYDIRYFFKLMFYLNFGWRLCSFLSYRSITFFLQLLILVLFFFLTQPNYNTLYIFLYICFIHLPYIILKYNLSSVYLWDIVIFIWVLFCNIFNNCFLFFRMWHFLKVNFLSYIYLQNIYNLKSHI